VEIGPVNEADATSAARPVSNDARSRRIASDDHDGHATGRLHALVTTSIGGRECTYRARGINDGERAGIRLRTRNIDTSGLQPRNGAETPVSAAPTIARCATGFRTLDGNQWTGRFPP